MGVRKINLLKIIKLAKSSLGFQYLAQASTAITSFALMYLMTSSGSLEVYGQYLALLAISSVVTNLIGIRTNEAIVRFVKEAILNNDIPKKRISLILGVTVDFTIASIVFFLFTIFDLQIAKLLFDDAGQSSDVQFFGLYSALIVISGSPAGYLMALEKLKLNALLTIGSNFSKLGILVFFVSNGAEIALSEITTALVLSTFFLASPIVIIFYEVFYKLRQSKKSLDKDNIIAYLSFSLKTFVSSSLKAGNKKIDDLAVVTFAGDEQLGLYGLIKQFFVPLHYAAGPIATVWYPKFITAVNVNKKSLGGIIGSLNRKLMPVLVALIIVFLTLSAGYLIYLDNVITTGLIITVLFSGLTALFQASQWWARPLSNTCNPNWSINSNLFSSIMSICVLIPMVFLHGIVGAAVTSAFISAITFGYWKMKLRSISYKEDR